MKLAVFPKCYIEALSEGRMPLIEWVDMAETLDVEGLELYERFLERTDTDYLSGLRDTLQRRGLRMPMLCCSPDFTHPDPAQRRRAIDGEAAMIVAAHHLGGPGVACRVLSGQAHPEVSVEDGVAWTVSAIEQLLPLARKLNVVLAMENHFKDGYWRYPEFAQRPDIFHRIVNAISDRDHFGVQFDPSNAITAGVDSSEFLLTVIDRVVTMQASDRQLAPGHTLDELRTADGT
jgi:sugar phosphate isomerase/epimerase